MATLAFIAYGDNTKVVAADFDTTSACNWETMDYFHHLVFSLRLAGATDHDGIANSYQRLAGSLQSRCFDYFCWDRTAAVISLVFNL